MSTEEVCTCIEKIQLAREHKVAKWLEEGLISLVNGDYRLTRADLSTLGWETSALIFWIRDNSIPSLNNSPYRFTKDMIQCGNCSSNLETGLASECFSCDLPLGIGEHTIPVASLLQNALEKSHPLVRYDDICCSACGHRFYNYRSIRCTSCSLFPNNVRIALKKRLDNKIIEVFGDEIRACEFVV